MDITMTNIDNLLLDNLNTYVESLNTTSFMEECITLAPVVTSILSIILAAYSLYSNVKLTKKTMTGSLLLQARIAWIQDVRHATTEFISACNTYLEVANLWKSEDITEEKIKELNSGLEIKYNNVRMKQTLLILFLGPDTFEKNLSEKEIEGLLNNSLNNEGKNDYLVKHIEKIVTNLVTYHSNMSNMRFNNKIMSGDGSDYVKGYTAKDMEKRPKSNENIVAEINKLSNYMRIYLKAEWTGAKRF